jgi:hypothetical protein
VSRKSVCRKVDELRFSIKTFANITCYYYVPSSVISAIKYNPSTCVLRITFVSGMVYEYKSVPEHIYLKLKTSGSKGKYLNTHIKGTYSFKKVNPESISDKAS